MRMRQQSVQTNRRLRLLALLLGAVFALAVLFPHAHVVYPEAHDDARCALTATVGSGALVLAAVAVLAFVLYVLGRLRIPQPVLVRTEVPLSFFSRAPPE